MEFTNRQIEKEAERLHWQLSGVRCDPHNRYTLEYCSQLALKTLEIQSLKQTQNAILLAHSYVLPEIVYGVADFKSDSYALALEARNTKAKKVVFAGVVFMAETVKILSPETEVLIPDPQSGCSLADSLSAKELQDLKRQHPNAAVVCYINSTAEVKAESDVCVTSANVYRIIEKVPQEEILFVPDRLMAANIRRELKQRQCDKKIYSSQGTCEVHDQFNSQIIQEEKSKIQDLKVLSHPECTTEITEISDYVGSTGGMMEYVKRSPYNNFLMLTECGLVGRLEVELPEKNFVAGCKLCPYMKLNSLDKIIQVLKSPREDQVIKVPEDVRKRARKSIDKMFELTE